MTEGTCFSGRSYGAWVDDSVESINMVHLTVLWPPEVAGRNFHD
jgi:hypothetical protein